MKKNQIGFTLTELIIVIFILGIVALVAIPRLLDLSSSAKISSLKAIAAEMDATITLVQNKARIAGLRTTSINPGAGQDAYVIDVGFARSEVDFRNLCPEASAEFADAIDFFEYMQDTLGDLEQRTDNQYARVGFDVPSSGNPTNQGCYIIYDSFAEPNCTIEIVTEDC